MVDRSLRSRCRSLSLANPMLHLPKFFSLRSTPWTCSTHLKMSEAMERVMRILRSISKGQQPLLWAELFMRQDKVLSSVEANSKR